VQSLDVGNGDMGLTEHHQELLEFRSEFRVDLVDLCAEPRISEQLNMRHPLA
jgi:hypothetical protein